MTKRKRKIILSCVSLAAFVVILAGILSEYGSVSATAVSDRKTYVDANISDTSGWQTVTGDSVSIVNDNYTLTMDTKSTRFMVENRQSGEVYSSYPETELNLLADDDISRKNSNVALTYYDKDYNLHYMGSGNDSVNMGQFSIQQKGSSLRVTYYFGSMSSNLFAPNVIKQSSFDNLVSSGISASELRKLKLYYKLYSADSQPSDYSDKLSKYPALKNQALYILTDDITDQIIQEISAIMKKSAYTEDIYKSELSDMNIGSSDANIPVGFTIPLELSLESDGFSARILTDLITENNSTDVLTSVYLLEYFGAVGSNATGNIVVPDGSGAYVSLNQATAKNYVQHIYNEDYLLNSEDHGGMSRQVSLPYFGLLSDQTSFMAVVEGGAAAGTVYARTMGKANPMNTVFTVFDIRTVDKTDIGKNRNIASLNVYSDHLLYEHPKIHYLLLSKVRSTLSDAAVSCRSVFEKDGILSGNVDGSGSIPLYLDFLCLTSEEKNISGITYRSPVVLSDLKSITEVVQTLHDSGVTNLRVRLKGWSEEGLIHSAFSTCKLSSKVGTTAELEALRLLVEGSGGKLYLDTDFSFAQENSWFDDLKLSLDTACNLEKSMASMKQYDLVTLKKTDTFNLGYIISPFSYIKFAQKFLNGFQSSAYSKLGLSWSNGGMYLTGDYKKSVDYDMPMAANRVSAVFSLLDQASNSVMTDYGYSYTLPYVSDVVNFPLTASNSESETASIPFGQMILDGFKSLSGAALNLTGAHSQLTDMAATATAPYYLFITSSDDKLKDTKMNTTYYSLDYRKHLAELISDYETYNACVSKVYGEKLTDFQWLDDELSRSGFADGTVLLANRSSEDKTVGGVTVPAYGYVLQ